MNGALPSSDICEFCGMHGVEQTYRDHQFWYGAGEDAVLLTVRAPVVVCHACGASVLGEGAEEIRHEAVCNHLKRLTPKQVRVIRTKHGLSQSAFADITGIGIASLKRWEAGGQIQNASIDRYLRLLALGRNMQSLKAIDRSSEAETPVFRTVISDRALRQSKRFSLTCRRAAA